MSDFQSPQVQTNFKDSNGADLGTKLVTKDYLISVYPSIGQQIGIPPELWTWGSGFSGQLGTNDTTDRSTPVTTFAGGTDWKQVSGGLSHTAAIKTDGTLWTWGLGSDGRLGNAQLTTRSTPVTTFAGGTDWKQVSAGNLHTAAIKTDGTLWVWGAGSVGRLGTNDLTNRSTPVTTFAGGTDWKQVSAGGSHTAAIKTDGTLWTWGSGSFGRLGTNDTTNRSTPVTTFAGGTNWKQVSSGGFHTAAIKTDGTLWTWGLGGSGQLGTNDFGSRSTPVTTFAGGTDWKQVSGARDQHTAAIKTDGTLWTWGAGGSGRLGRDSLDSTKISTPVTTFAGGTNWADTATGAPEELYTLSFGYRSAAAIKTDGTLWTWGRGRGGALGINDTTDRATPVTTFAGGTNWKQVNAGYNVMIAIKTDGTLWTWGQQLGGVLGTNDTTNRSTPVTTFAGGTNWKQSSGYLHIAAIKTDGTLWTWGDGFFGELGTNDTTDRSTPVTTFAGGTDWKQVSAGNAHTAAIKTDGTLWTWGLGGSGRLGDALDNDKLTPVTTFAGGTNWADAPTTEPEDLYTLSASGSHTVAIKTDGTLWTWGFGTSGRLGNASTTSPFTISTPVTTFAGGTNWKQVSSGGTHTAAIKTDGTLWTWGNGSSGRLGNAQLTTRSTPVTTFAGGTDWKQVSSGGSHTAAIKTDGTLWTWGIGTSAQLGTNDTTQRSTPVTTFAGGSSWKQVSSGGTHTAAIKTDGTLWAWGAGSSGRLGTNDTTNRSTPVTTFAGGTNWKQVSAGGSHTAAIKTDGTLWTWGFGLNGRLGTNDLTDRSTPVTTFAGGTNWKQISSSSRHTAAIKTDGTLWTWGDGTYGRLGTNDTTQRSTPVTTFAGGSSWKQVSSGDFHTVALKDDGVNKELFVFGNGGNGRLGAAESITSKDTPVTTFAGGNNWKQVSCGGSHTTATKTDGTLWTWGSGDTGELGTNDLSSRSTPVTTFAGGTNWKQVSAGIAHIAAIKTDGTLWTWGDGFFGELGTNDTTDRSTPVTTFAGGTDWKQVNCGYFNTIALRDDGINKELFVWGNNSGSNQLGFLANSTNTIPLKESTLSSNWKQVSAGTTHTAAIKTDGNPMDLGWLELVDRLGNQ
jgi:alpha-tubulin suppressor-like RCC1 family protein